MKNAEINSLKEEILTLTKNNNKLKLDYEEITRKFESELSKNKNNNENIFNLNLLNEQKQEINENNEKIIDELKLNNIRNEKNKIIEQMEKE